MFQLKLRVLFIAFLALMTTACNPCIYRYCKEGPAEFVLDSYKIREGKLSILEMEGACIACIPPHFLLEYDDIIDEDDVLQIFIFHPTRCDLTQIIDRVGQTTGYRVINGAIHLPQHPNVYLLGLTLSEARQKIEALYKQELANVEVFIEYIERLHSKIELSGEVAISQIPVNGRLRLFEALSLAKINPCANLFKSYVERDGCLLPIDLYKLVHEGDMCQNIVMRPRDKIFIAEPSAASILMLGEIGMARAIPVPHGYLSLREALAIAGGIPFTGDKRCIQVIRGNIVNPKIYTLSWNHITYLPNDSLLLMAGDTVYISERPITKWNRFIEQLLPSGLLIDLGLKTRGLFN